MHPLAVKEIVESVRRRAAQGDCPTEPAQSVETLEEVILELTRGSSTPETRPEYCTCPFTDGDGTVVAGEPCSLHPTK